MISQLFLLFVIIVKKIRTMNRYLTLLLLPVFAIAQTAYPKSPKKGKNLDSVAVAAQKIDEFIEKGYSHFDVKPNERINDETFVRRVYLDIAGRTPTISEVREFLNSDYAQKRQRFIKDLLHSEAYVSHFYNFWADVLRINDGLGSGARAAEAAYRLWVKDSLRNNKPYDQFVRELISAKGYIWENGAVGYYQRDRGMSLDNMSNTVRVFLGVRLECAQCHNHPFDKWTQMDYYKMAAFTYGMEANRYESPNRSGISDYLKQQQQESFAKAVGLKGFPAIRNESGLRKALRSRKLDRFLTRANMTREEFENKARKGIEAASKFGRGNQDMRQAVKELYDPIKYIAAHEKSNKTLKLPHDYQYSDASPEDSVEFATMFGAEINGMDEGSSLSKSYAEWMTSPENPTFTRGYRESFMEKGFRNGIDRTNR